MTARQHIATLRSMAANFTAAAEGHEEEDELAQAELWQERADAIRWALGQLDPPVTWRKIMAEQATPPWPLGTIPRPLG